MLPACRALLLFALLALCTAARPFKRAPLQHGAHFVVLEEHTDSLREVAEHFKVDLEDLLDYNQQVSACVLWLPALLPLANAWGEARSSCGTMW
jgi:hypothetical protein